MTHAVSPVPTPCWLVTRARCAGEDMDRMQALLDELDKLNAKATSLDVTLLDKKIDQMMPELGFK
jgi:hypothetical protein